MVKPIRLLLSARDPAAAAAMRVMAQAAAADPGFETVVVAADPAHGLLAECGVSAERIPAPPPGKAVEQARHLLRKERPDALLVGLSGPEPGLDEALLAAAEMPTFAVQDFWGNVNDGFGRRAGTYFVQDRRAAILTRAHGAEAIEVGSVRYADRVGCRDVPRLRRKARGLCGLTENGFAVSIFGQPLWMAPGYARTLEAIGRVLARHAAGVPCFFRPHPKETSAERAEAFDRLAFGIGDGRVSLRPMPDMLDASMAAVVADLQISVWSSIAVDLCMFGRISPLPVGLPVHAPLDAELAAWLQAWSGLNRMPPAEDGAILHCSSERQLGRWVEAMQHPAKRRGLASAHHRRLESVLPSPDDSPRTILDHIAARVGSPAW